MMSFTLKTYLVIGDVDGLEKGVYLYRPAGHRLMKLLDGEYIPQLSDANAGTYFVRGGALYFVFAATNRSSSDFDKYQHMEVGHATQNVYLQCVSLGLGTVVNGGFNADRTRELLQISATERLLYIMPVGRMTGA
jgi:SagB-type dehydrogenase family enzyme